MISGNLLQQESVQIDEGQARFRFCPGGAPLQQIGVGITGQQSKPAHQGTDEALDVTAEPRGARRSIDRVDIVQVAAASKCLTVKLLPIVGV